jgi:hypothetical protein
VVTREGERQVRIVERTAHGMQRIETNEPMRSGVRRESRAPRDSLGYSWLEDYLARLEGKEARREYYAWLE